MIFTKDPDAVLDYAVDWSLWLAGDTISTSTWILPSGTLTESAAANTGTAATIWLRGGEEGKRYTVTNRIVTAGCRTDDRSITIKVESR